MVNNGKSSIRVLHVDADADFGDLLVRFFTDHHDRITVVTESRVADGRARLRDGSFDCIVSNHRPPEQDGLALLRTVRETHPELPFLLFTGQASDAIASDAISAGVTDYLEKRGGVEQFTVLANRIANAVDRYRANRRMELSHRAMETATEGLSLVDPDGTFLYVNPAFAELFGYDQERLIGADWRVLYHNDEAERLEATILPAVRETGYWAGETVRLTNHGERRITDHRLAYTDPTLDAIVCTAKDVTEERRGATTQTTPFDLLVDTMDLDAFYTLDHEGYLTRWNEGAERLTGYDADAALGQHVTVFFTDEARQQGVPERLLNAAASDGSVTETHWQVREDGTRFGADVRIVASYDEHGTLRGFGTAITESAPPTTDAADRLEAGGSLDAAGDV